MSVPTSTESFSFSSSAKLKPPSPDLAIFQEALRDFRKNFSVKDLAYFESVSFQQLEDTIEKIQFHLKIKKQMRNIARIKPFLEAMIQYEKIIEVFLDNSNLLAFVWGPIKMLLTISSTFTDAFDCLLAGYDEIGECLPLYSQYEEYFQRNPYMQKMLGYVYKDLLTFHSRVYKIMSKPSKSLPSNFSRAVGTLKMSIPQLTPTPTLVWKNVFTITSSSFKAALVETRTNLLRHKALVESQAGLLDFDNYHNDRKLTEQRFQENERVGMRRQRMEVFEWLSMPSPDSIPAALDQKHFANKRKDYPTSGQWLQTCRAYQEWIDPQAIPHIPVIWLYGIPGAGKTILASYVIEQACQVSEFDVGWFYCKFGNTDKSTLLGVMRGIFAELVKKNDQLCPHILEARNKSGVRKLTSPQAGKDLMSECLRVLDKTCIIIDGLDECDLQEQNEIILLYTRLAKELNDDEPGSLRILFVSTDEFVIRNLLSNAVHIRLKATDNFVEILHYARTRAKKIQELFGLTEQEMEGIVAEVVKRADGMYLYCHLVLNNLHSQCTREGLDRELQSDCLPNGLGDMYDKILTRIDAHPQPVYRAYALRILGWVACSRRPLKWHEIQGILSVGTNGAFDLKRRLLRVGAKELCGALVDVQSDGTVEFVHPTAREHRDHTSQLPPKEPWIDIAAARFRAALVCVQYLTMDCFRVDLSDDEVHNFVQKGYYCLQDYAVVYWYDHVELCLQGVTGADLRLHPLLSALSAFLRRNWHASMGIDRAKNKKSTPARAAQRLKILDDARFPEVFPKLICFASAREDLYFGSSPLNFEIPVRRARACLEAQQDSTRAQVQEYYGHRYFKCNRENCRYFSEGFSTLGERDKHELLHNRDFRCSETTCPSTKIGFATPVGLQSHMRSQHPQNMYILSPKEDDSSTINLANSNDISLMEAVEAGQLNIVKTLVQRGTDVNTREDGRTALHLAASNGHEDIARMLLENRASVDAKDNEEWTPLHQAASNGFEGIARMLLENGASVDAKDNEEWTPLHQAASNGFEGIARMLLENGAGVEAQDNEGWGALHVAADGGHEGVAQLLLNHGADVEAQNNKGWTPLNYATHKGHEGIARMLLENGASLDVKNTKGGMPQHLTAGYGRGGVARMAHGVGVDSVLATTIPPQCIAHWYHSCIKGFEKVTVALDNLVTSTFDHDSHVNNHDQEQTSPQLMVQEQVGRFRVWAGNMGAHQKGRLSLDYKLREASDIHDTVLELLGELNMLLIEMLSSMQKNTAGDGVDGVDGDAIMITTYTPEGNLSALDCENTTSGTGATLSDLGFMLDDTADIISCLYSLSVAMRQPTPQDRLKKYAAIDMSHYKVFDVQHIRDKFPSAKPFLIQRLGNANTQRRQYFKYQFTHREKLVQGLDDIGGANSVDITAGRASTTISISPQTAAVSTQSTLVDGIEVESDGGNSATSFGTAMQTVPPGDSEPLKVPDPRNADEVFAGNAFQCPYCYSLIVVQNSKAWQRHVFRDLRPYSCTFEFCTKPNHLFETRYEWYDHEMRHHRLEWYCAECAIAFPTIPKFTLHLKEIHPKLLVEGQEIAALVRNCERALSIPQECPLCPSDSKHTPHQLRTHLSRHMQQLALFTLPMREIAENEGGDIQIVGGLKEKESESTEEDEEGMLRFDFDSSPNVGNEA